jgi:hypothetical protein
VKALTSRLTSRRAGKEIVSDYTSNSNPVSGYYSDSYEFDFGSVPDEPESETFTAEQPLSGPATGLVITSTPAGRFGYWPDHKPVDLTDRNSRYITYLDSLPFQQGETLRKYMRRLFDKRATVVDVTDKEVIDLFQDGVYHRRTFEDFGRRGPSSITKLKDMITAWADEEDKANAKYDAICGKIKKNAGSSNNNNRDQGGRNNNYSGPKRKRKPDNKFVAIQRPAKDNSKKTSGGFNDLLKEKCPWYLEGNHTTEQCYQLRRALKDSLDPRHPHDRKGKKKADEGNGDFQEPDKTVNVLFGGLPTKQSQKATRREVLNIEPTTDPSPVAGGTHHLLPCGSMDKLLWTRAFSSCPKAGSCGLQTQQGTHRWWERAQCPFHQDLEEDEPRHHSHAHQEHIAFLLHRPRERDYSTRFGGPASYLRGIQRKLPHRVHQVHGGTPYTYLVLKMPSPAGVLPLQGDLKISIDCDTEAVELAAMMEIYVASKKLAPSELDIPEKSHKANKPQPSEEVQVKEIDLGTGDTSKTTMIGAGLDPK